MELPIITTPHSVSEFGKDLDLLSMFFNQVKERHLLENQNPEHHQKLRQDVRASLHRLVDFGRPILAVQQKMLWPYQALIDHEKYFHETLNDTAFLKDQALRYLTLLPFPGQWQRLLEAERVIGSDPEMDRFFRSELTILNRKVKKKQQKTYLVHHMCQVLKTPNLPKEKGILRVFALPYLWIDQDLLKALSERYVLYVEPSAGIHLRFAWMRNFTKLEDPVVIGAAAEEDRMFLKTQKGIIVTHLCHGDYVDPELVTPVQRDKDFDMVFNSTFDDIPLKRHELLLKCLGAPRLKNSTALFIGRGNDENLRQFEKMTQQYGVTERVTVKANIKRTDVHQFLARCKIGIHLCLHENGCRSVAEFICAGLPCVASELTSGLPNGMINPETGKIANDQNLETAIADTLQQWHTYNVRDWFLNHSGSINKSRELNKVFKQLFKTLGYEWKTDIAPLDSSGVNRYFKKQDLETFMPEFEQIYQIFKHLPQMPVPIVGP